MQNLCLKEKNTQKTNLENDSNKNEKIVENAQKNITTDKRRRKKHSKGYIKKLKNPNYKSNQKRSSHKWYVKNKISLKRRKEYNPLKRKEYMKKYPLNNTEKHFEHKLKTRFGMSLKDYEKLLTKQNGTCAICKQLETVKWSNGNERKPRKNLCVDHNHKTGKIRGLLCHFCNVGIGHFKENPKLLKRAIKYLTGNS